MVQRPSNAASIPNPNRVIVQAQNAERVARRRATATLAANVARTSAQSLQRGPGRQVGGVFETLQDVPSATIRQPQRGFTEQDAARFLSAFQFSPQREVLSESRSSTVSRRGAFAPGEINRIIQSSRGIRSIDPISGRPRSRRQREGLFGGVIISPF